MFSFHTERKQYSAKIWSDDALLLTWTSVTRVSSGHFRAMKTAQSRTLNSLFSPKVFGSSDTGRQASGFYGTRPKSNPIWHSHREATRACNRCEGHWPDSWGQSMEWTVPPQHYALWLVACDLCFPALWSLSLAPEKSCHVGAGDVSHDKLAPSRTYPIGEIHECPFLGTIW